VYGEEAGVSALSHLSDDFHIINDVHLNFRRALFWNKTGEYLKSCQIDHIVIGPTGIFLLETKNWKPSDIGTKSDKLIWQMNRSRFALWPISLSTMPRVSNGRNSQTHRLAEQPGGGPEAGPGYRCCLPQGIVRIHFPMETDSL